MHTLNEGYRGVSLLVRLTFDRVIFAAALIGALYAGSYFALI